MSHQLNFLHDDSPRIIVDFLEDLVALLDLRYFIDIGVCVKNGKNDITQEKEAFHIVGPNTSLLLLQASSVQSPRLEIYGSILDILPCLKEGDSSFVTRLTP
jgi:hypothetical protein